MQFIDFKKDHFSHNEGSNLYFIQISKEEVGFGEINVLEKQEDETYTKADFELLDEPSKITVKMKTPANIRINF